MGKIFIVTSGEYSSYGIDGVFTTKEKAEAWANMFGGGFDIEEYETDPLQNEARQGFLSFSVNMKKNGDYVEGRKTIISGTHVHRIRDGYYDEESKYADYIIVNCLAKDFQHAVKIANKKRLQLIANNDWD